MQGRLGIGSVARLRVRLTGRTTGARAKEQITKKAATKLVHENFTGPGFENLPSSTTVPGLNPAFACSES